MKAAKVDPRRSFWPKVGMNEEVRFKFLVADAIDTGDSEAVRRVINENPEQVFAFTPFAGGTWLHYAAGQSTPEIVSTLLELGFDVNAGDRHDGRIAITDACHAGKADIVRLLLEHGARIDISKSVRNPLIAAILGGSAEIVDLLLDRGIDVRVRYNSRTMTDMDAVAFAMMHGKRDLARKIALHVVDGDAATAEKLMADGLQVAYANTSKGRRKKPKLQ